MPHETQKYAPTANRLLAGLPKKDYLQLLPNLEQFPLNFGSILQEPAEIIRYVYFPASGIVSLLATTGSKASLEVGMIGKEGMLGVPAFMGVTTTRERAVVQGSGVAWRMRATELRTECSNGSKLTQLLHRYTNSLLTQLRQSAVCNRFHPIEARLARWLLMTRDRMGTNEFQMTQEYLSHMLGVRREGVNKAAGVLQRRKLVSYSRGTLTILKGTALEAVACECYRIIKDEYDCLTD
jgi:CRP-like cAMP-binding protein